MKKISALISAIIVIVTACGSILAWFENKLTERLDSRIEYIETTVKEIRQDTIRLQLNSLIDGDSENVESILTVAKTYFIDMGGDWYMTEKFKSWGRAHDVDLSDFTFTATPSSSNN